MATRAAVDRFARSNRQIRSLVTRDLRSLWATLPSSPQLATLAVVEFVPALIQSYGDVSATVAAEFFEDTRAAANAPGRVTTRLAPNPALEAMLINLRWAASPFFDGNPADALARTTQIADRMSLQAGRDTIDQNVRNDPAGPRWARVPTGPETCAWCLMLASRGPAYGSERSAGGDANRYHSDCDCTPTPVWPGDALPAGYDPDQLYDRYIRARDEAGTGSTRAVLSELRKLEGIH